MAIAGVVCSAVFVTISPMRRTLHAFLLVLAFLFAQDGMLAHAASHGVSVGHAGDEGVPSDAVCELCVGYAQLGGSAPPSVMQALPVCLAGHETPDAYSLLFVSRAVVHSRARAPPLFS